MCHLTSFKTNRYFNHDRSSTYQEMTPCMLDTHKITKRLYSYIIDLIGKESYRQIGQHVGLSTPTITSICDPVLDQFRTEFSYSNSVIVTEWTYKNHTYCAVLERNHLRLLDIQEDSKDILASILLQSQIKEIICPIDIYEKIDLKAFRSDSSIYIDKNSLKHRIAQTCFKMYQNERTALLKRNKSKELRYVLSRNKQKEKQYFFLLNDKLTLEQEKELHQLLDQNSAFRAAYAVRNSFLKMIQDDNRVQTFSKQGYQYMAFIGNEHDIIYKPQSPFEQAFYNSVCSNEHYKNLLELISKLNAENRIIELPNRDYNGLNQIQGLINKVGKRVTREQLLYRFRDLLKSLEIDY